MLARAGSTDKQAVADAAAATDLDTIVGPLKYGAGGVPKNVATTSLVGGQWQKTNGGEFEFDLVVTNNKLSPEIPAHGRAAPAGLTRTAVGDGPARSRRRLQALRRRPRHRGLHVPRCRGRGPRHRGAERRGQDHAAEPGRRRPATRQGHDPPRRGRRHPAAGPRPVPSRIGRTAQIPRPFEGLTVFENVLVGSDVRTRRTRLLGTSQDEAAVDALETTRAPRQGERRRGHAHPAAAQASRARAGAGDPAERAAARRDRGRAHRSRGARARRRRSAASERRGVSIVWIEHIVHALLRVVDRMMAVDAGRKLIEGDPHEVMASDAVRAVYLGEEFGADEARRGRRASEPARDRVDSTSATATSRRCSASTSTSTRPRPCRSSVPTAPASRRC